MVIKVICILTLLLSTFCLKFNISIPAGENTCFYEVLEVNQKYSVDVIPHPNNQQIYEITISNMIDGSRNIVYYKLADQSSRRYSIHKLASVAATYLICVRNTGETDLKIQLSIQSGLELMEFELLPNQNDTEILNRQLQWIDIQKNALFQSLSRMEGLRNTAEGITNIMSQKMIGFAIIGLLAIIMVNFIFYRELKKTFKQRKLI